MGDDPGELAMTLLAINTKVRLVDDHPNAGETATIIDRDFDAAERYWPFGWVAYGWVAYLVKLDKNGMLVWVIESNQVEEIES